MVAMSPGQAPQVFFTPNPTVGIVNLFPHLLKSSQDWDRQPAFGEQAQAHRVPTICLTIVITTDTGHRLFQMHRGHRPAEQPPSWVAFHRLLNVCLASLEHPAQAMSPHYQQPVLWYNNLPTPRTTPLSPNLSPPAPIRNLPQQTACRDPRAQALGN